MQAVHHAGSGASSEMAHVNRDSVTCEAIDCYAASTHVVVDKAKHMNNTNTALEDVVNPVTLKACGPE